MKIKRSDFLKLMSVTAASAVLAGCGSSVVEQAAQSRLILHKLSVLIT